jgi:hypothetical protein
MTRNSVNPIFSPHPFFIRSWLLPPFVKGGGERFKKAISYVFQKDDITRFRERFGMTLLESWPVSRSSKQIFDRKVPRKPRLVGGVKGHNMNEISSPGSPALWAGSFNILTPLSFFDSVVSFQEHRGWVRRRN